MGIIFIDIELYTIEFVKWLVKMALYCNFTRLSIIKKNEENVCLHKSFIFDPSIIIYFFKKYIYFMHERSIITTQKVKTVVSSIALITLKIRYLLLL